MCVEGECVEGRGWYLERLEYLPAPLAVLWVPRVVPHDVETLGRLGPAYVEGAAPRHLANARQVHMHSACTRTAHVHGTC